MKRNMLLPIGAALLLLSCPGTEASPPGAKYTKPAIKNTKASKAPTKRIPNVKAAVSGKSKTRAIRIKIPPNLDKNHLGTASASATVFYLQSLAEVLPFVDAIVIGKPLVAFSQRDHYATFSPINATESLVDHAWSIGSFRIERVLYQNANHGITGLSEGQTINVGEAVAIIPNGDGFVRFRLETCSELKQNSRYVVFLLKRAKGTYLPQYTSMYETCNLALGQFNIDGTDLDDEVGGRSWKESLRQELTAAYGVSFAVPTTVAPSIASLSANSAVQGGAAFTLTVNGSDFKNGAVVTFGNTEKATTFLSATQLSVPILASEISSAGSIPVVVKNPDNQASANQPFVVQEIGLPPVTIVSAFYDNGGGGGNVGPTRPRLTFVRIAVTRPQLEGTTILLEKQNPDGSWVNASVFGGPAVPEESLSGSGNVETTVVSPGQIVTGTLLQARVQNGSQTSAYSPLFTMP